VQALIDTDTAASEDEKVMYLFTADNVSMEDAEYRLPAVDLYDEPGRTFRVLPRWFVDVSANLSIAKMDFADAAEPKLINHHPMPNHRTVDWRRNSPLSGA
jgi:hypothetical protein